MNHLQAGSRLAQMNTKESPLGVQSHQERKLDFLTNTCLLLVLLAGLRRALRLGRELFLACRERTGCLPYQFKGPGFFLVPNDLALNDWGQTTVRCPMIDPRVAREQGAQGNRLLMVLGSCISRSYKETKFKVEKTEDPGSSLNTSC